MSDRPASSTNAVAEGLAWFIEGVVHDTLPRCEVRCELDTQSLAHTPFEAADAQFRSDVGEIAAEVSRATCPARRSGRCQVKLHMSGQPITGTVSCTWQTDRRLNARRLRALEAFVDRHGASLINTPTGITVALRPPHWT
jgi:hypothetical protein